MGERMNSKEKVLNALNHQEGAVPLDLGAGGQTGLHCTCVAQLRDYYGLEKRPVKVHEPFQMLGWVDKDLQDAMGVDVSAPMPGCTMFGYANEHWKEWRTPWGQTVLVGAGFETLENGKGVHVYPQGDRSVEPSALMPDGGFFFDATSRDSGFDEDELDVEENLEEFGPVSDSAIQKMRDAAVEAGKTGRAVFGGLPGTALGDVALVPAVQLKAPKGIRDVEEWYVSTVIRQDYIHELFERQSDIAVENIKRMAPVLGDSVDLVFLCGTDFGTQSGTFCSPETFRELWLPYYRKMTDCIHELTNWKVFKHSCGAVETFMQNFIDAGVDIINPVQCSATGMDPKALKERYGDKLVFWGGGVDTQKTLPFGTPEEVRKEVLERCEIFSPNGGFVFNAIHNVQAQTPLENMVAMLDAVKEFNRG